MHPLAQFQFESNALFVAQQLRLAGIGSNITPSTSGEELNFILEVDAEHLENAKIILANLEVDETDLDEASEGYLEGHLEWNKKMYDPGHYTGGKIPHYLFNKDIWKYIAPLYLVGGIAVLAFIFFSGASIDAETLLWIGLYLFVGLSMFWQLYGRK